MRKLLLLLLLLIGTTVSAQFSNLTKEQYAENVDNYKPGSQVFVMLGKNTWEVGYSYTDILTWGASFERTQFDSVNNQKPFYAIYGSIGGEFERVTITVKMGATRLQQMGATEQTIHFTYGGSFEYRVTPNIGLAIGSDSTCDTVLYGLVYHIGEK